MIPYGKHYIDEDDIQAVIKVLRSGSLTQGSTIKEFEDSVAKYVGAKYAVAVSSATAGLHLASIAAGVSPGNNLITSPISFVASANAGIYAGGSVAFADIDPNTLNISPLALKETLKKTSNTKAIIPVHFGGLPCDTESIKKIADDNGSYVIEDAAHSLGATYPDGQKVGCCSNSLMTVFSFHPVKVIAAGEGGMITTNEETVYRNLLRLRSHGINKLDDNFQIPKQGYTNGLLNPWYYEMQELGFHYRITDIQCSLALSQLKKLDTFIKRRRELVLCYDEAFSSFKNLCPAQISGRGYSGHHLYILKINFDQIGLSRSELMTELRSRGIGSQVHYIPIPRHPYYQNMGIDPDQFLAAEEYYSKALSIPLFYSLTSEQQKKVISTLTELVERV